MGNIKLVEPYAVAFGRDQITNSLQYHGEEAILLQAFHPGDADSLPCICKDDVYNQSPANCPDCYGTSFAGGIRQAVRVWAMFSDTREPENYDKRGTWQLDQREIQTEAFPTLIEHDFVVRVAAWGAGHVVNQLDGIYAVQSVVRNSLRTGNRFGQQSLDIVGQRATCTLLATGMPIAQYVTTGRSFARASQAASPVTGLPQPTVQPDNRVIYLPTSTNAANEGRYVADIGDGASTKIIVTHGLGTSDVLVSLRDTVTGELVDADVVSKLADALTLTFATAPAVGAYRIVIQS